MAGDHLEFIFRRTGALLHDRIETLLDEGAEGGFVTMSDGLGAVEEAVGNIYGRLHMGTHIEIGARRQAWFGGGEIRTIKFERRRGRAEGEG